MELDQRVCDRARRSRDARFDGRFFIAVTSTGIYCRPICPARAPKDEHVRYFPSAAAAEAAGFRPCLRCRPEASPGTPAWLGTSGLVSRALRLIGEGAIRGAGAPGVENVADGVEHLADRLGVTARHLRRLFLQHLGATPLDVALTRRVHFARKLLDETTLPINQVAFASGFGSVRRFNSQIRRTYKRTPSELRRLVRQQTTAGPECYRFRLAYRPPYDWDSMLSFLRARATPGVESVDAFHYRRTIQIDGKVGVIDVSHLESRSALALDVRFPEPRALLLIVERVRRVFDLGADPAVIAEHLRADPLLRRPLLKHPGMRTPGAWDGFELAVRAILGQQISVRAATTIAGRIASMFGTPLSTGLDDARDDFDRLDRLFPTPAQLASAPVERAGVMPARAETIRCFARKVADGTITLSSCLDGRATAAALRAVPGIGDWTAEYIAMRAFGEPDAFPSGDLVLRRVAGDCSARELERKSDAWRPWRAYAVMLLWRGAADSGEESRRMKHAQPEERSKRRRRARRAVDVAALRVAAHHGPR
jgi:AraC family transcriptional regulator of adaptative response / DNA-3-methyladenine glycosylase II